MLLNHTFPRTKAAAPKYRSAWDRADSDCQAAIKEEWTGIWGRGQLKDPQSAEKRRRCIENTTKHGEQRQAGCCGRGPPWQKYAEKGCAAALSLQEQDRLLNLSVAALLIRYWNQLRSRAGGGSRLPLLFEDSETPEPRQQEIV